MIFTEKEQREIEDRVKEDELLRRLWDEYLNYQEDAGKLLALSYKKAVKKLAQIVDDGLVKPDDPWIKLVLEIGKGGDKLFNTMDRGSDADVSVGSNASPTESKRGKKHAGKVVI